MSWGGADSVQMHCSAPQTPAWPKARLRAFGRNQSGLR